MSHEPATRLLCSGCGAAIRSEAPIPFRCPRARPGDDVDHVLVRRLDAARVGFPRAGESNPFVRYRELFHSYQVARAAGLDDAEYVRLAERLDRAVAAVEGHGFEVTPCRRSPELSQRLGCGARGGVWIKDETGNVSGSHKGRHLMGVALLLEVQERLEPARREPPPTLAIASCGNAALAAAVIAHAAGRALEVFVPPDAEPKVLARLERLGARLASCPRLPGERGDPCMRHFRDAIEGGAIPFSCQGSENGLVIEGGETIGYEIASALADQGQALDRLFVQVGGGALASACVQALQEAVAFGLLPRLPRIHAVQSRGGFPLVRAYERVAERVLARIASRGTSVPPRGPGQRAELMAKPEWEPLVREELVYASTHRSEFMWPWEETPRSIARGILDDETYDWRAVVAGMIGSGGYPVTVSEARLEEAHALARAGTHLPVCPTGSAGLAGLVDVIRSEPTAADETVAVIFSGKEH